VAKQQKPTEQKPAEQKPTVSAPSLYVIYSESERNAPKFAINCYSLEIIEGRKAYPPKEDTT
jgi:hypothetical protein